MMMFLDDFLNLPQLSRIQSVIHGQRYKGLQPEFCFSILAGNMDMHPVLFVGKEIKPIAFFSEN
jgi:hypothetical protein